MPPSRTKSRHYCMFQDGVSKISAVMSTLFTLWWPKPIKSPPHCRTDQVISRPKLKIFIPKNYALNYSNHLLKGQGLRLPCRFDQKINKHRELHTQSMVMDNDYSFNKNRYNFSLSLLKIFRYKEI